MTNIPAGYERYITQEQVERMQRQGAQLHTFTYVNLLDFVSAIMEANERLDEEASMAWGPDSLLKGGFDLAVATSELIDKYREKDEPLASAE